ncbi:unnamed protein product [Rotaria sp. Silwood1]|nr:unnamed protein product [Rotaria sp. Silwood1]CAF1481637.1 unnamed protein product [Rotaria sp. Silwood1]
MDTPNMAIQQQHTNLTYYEELQQSLGPRAKLFLPTTDGYSQAKRIWNGMFDNHSPALIVQVTGVADVQAVLKFAHQRGLTVTARAGGHSFSGLSTIHDGIVIDFIQMKSKLNLTKREEPHHIAVDFLAVIVNPEKKEVLVEPGVVLAELDHEIQAFGLATPTGVVSFTGVFGLVLGGGIGWLSRKQILFGVNNYMKTAPREFACELFSGMRIDGDREMYLKVSYAFYLPEGEAEKVAEPLTKLGSPVQESWVWITHVQNQKLFDVNFGEHRKYYAKSGSIDFDDMTIEFVDSIVESVNNLTPPYSIVELVTIGGKMKETSADETSYFHLRKQDWLVNIITSWCEGNGDEHINWCRETYKKLTAKSRAAYINLMMMDPPTDTTYKEQLNNAFGSNLNRLRNIKKKYDPFNFFRHNLNLLAADDNNDN